jgi:Na+-transporting methylmalonyl-CoA/oxaloacetate decarboxylase, beta subunit
MDAFLAGFAALTVKQVIMLGIGGLLLYLAIAKQYEPGLAPSNGDSARSW